MIDWEKQFDEALKEPDIKNSGLNSPNFWIFEGYVAAKKEAIEFIRQTRLDLLKSIEEALPKEKENNREHKGTNTKDHCESCIKNTGYNQALQEIKSSLEQYKKEI